jgi:voltage-gated potassium channel
VRPARTVARRAALVLGLLLTAMLVFWLDREGINDNLDGQLSLIDIAYFTLVTVTTVGYGDIVPVSDRARFLDAVFVTPIRVFIWLVFLGTAYELVLQRAIEAWRMRRLQQKLADHVVICGCGASGLRAAREMAAAAMAPGGIVAVDVSADALEEAAQAGFIGLRGDPTREQVLGEAAVERARAVIVATGRDDTNVLIVLTARNLAPQARIVALSHEEENVKLMLHGGADRVIEPSRMSGLLLADAVGRRCTAEFLDDLMSARGDVRLEERPPAPHEIGRPLREIAEGRALRLYRGGAARSPWDGVAVQAGDVLIVIEPTARAAPVSG